MASILVVEDDQAIAQMIKLILSKQGHSLRHVMDGRQALSVILEWLPDLIISDVMMPGMDGFAMAEQLEPGDVAAPANNVFINLAH